MLQFPPLRFYGTFKFQPTLVRLTQQCCCTTDFILMINFHQQLFPQWNSWRPRRSGKVAHNYFIFFSKLSQNWRYISKIYLLSFNFVLFYSCFFPGFLWDFVLLWTSRDQIFLPNIVFLQWHWWRHKSSFMKSRLKSNGRWQKYIPELDRVSLSEYVSTTYTLIFTCTRRWWPRRQWWTRRATWEWGQASTLPR